MVVKFLDYIEIKTKITSLFAFLITIAFLLYGNYQINWKLTSIFFIAMFVFDLTTTAINNYIDTKTNTQTLQFKRNTALMIIYVMFGISASFGLYLAYLTDAVVLLVGAVCFLCGIFYTYGPVPLSRQPLGEVFSGIFYGLMIPFLMMYINMPEGTLVDLKVSIETISFNIKVFPLISLLLLSVIPVCVTANIMLANNICDVEKDVLVKRYTLPYYLGDKSLKLFAALYYLTYIALILMVILKILSPVCLAALISIIPVKKNIDQFKKVQDKSTTFMSAIKNYIIIMSTDTLLIFVSTILG